MPARRVDEEVVNERAPPKCGQGPLGVQVPHVEEVPIVCQGNEAPVVPLDITNEEVRGDLPTLAYAKTAQANQDTRHRINPIESTMTSRLTEFARMNSLIFFDLTQKDPSEFLDGAYKNLSFMVVNPREKVELDSY